MIDVTKFNTARALFWFVPLIFETVIETVSLIWPNLGILPLTRLIRYLPFDLIVFVLAWFTWHFGVRYFRPALHVYDWALWCGMWMCAWYLLKPYLPAPHFAK